MSALRIPDLGPLAKEIGQDLLEILKDEAAAAKAKLTPARRKRLEKGLKDAAETAARHAKGEDVAKEIQILASSFAHSKAIAAVVLARGAERAFARGLTVVGQALAILARAVLAGLM